MFRPARMVFVTVWLNTDYAEDLLRTIGKARIAHIVDSEALLCSEADTGVIQMCSRLLDRIEATSYLLRIWGLTSSASNYPYPEFDDLLPSKERLDYIESRLDILEGDLGIKADEIGTLLVKEVCLFTSSEVVKEAEKQNIKPAWLDSDPRLFSMTGLIEQTKKKRLKEILEAATNGEYVIAQGDKAKVYAGKQLITLVTLKEHKKELVERLGVIFYTGPIQKANPSINLRVLEEVVRKEQDFAINMKRSLSLLPHPETREQNCILQVWVPEKDVKKFENLISDASAGKATIKTRPPTEKDEVPVQLDNPLLFKPFEQVVEMFGSPEYDEIDPTPIVALSSLFFFGFMFGDAGHAALLLIGGIAYMRFGETAQKIAPVVILCALAGIVAGFMFGSFLGFEGIIHPLLGKPGFDVKTLLLVMSIGLAHMLSGIIIGLINQIPKKEGKTEKPEKEEKAAALTITVSQLLMLLGALALLFGNYLDLTQEIILPVALTLLGVPCILLPLSNILPAVSEGDVAKAMDSLLLSVSELLHLIMSVLSNTLSYLRILILALIHEVSSGLLAQGTTALAGMPVIGMPLAFILLVAGTLVILIEGGIIFIQCIRLQYYEFFSRFYVGSGLKFEPYSLR